MSFFTDGTTNESLLVKAAVPIPSRPEQVRTDRLERANEDFLNVLPVKKLDLALAQGTASEEQKNQLDQDINIVSVLCHTGSIPLSKALMALSKLVAIKANTEYESLIVSPTYYERENISFYAQQRLSVINFFIAHLKNAVSSQTDSTQSLYKLFFDFSGVKKEGQSDDSSQNKFIGATIVDLFNKFVDSKLFKVTQKVVYNEKTQEFEEIENIPNDREFIFFKKYFSLLKKHYNQSNIGRSDLINMYLDFVEFRTQMKIRFKEDSLTPEGEPKKWEYFAKQISPILENLDTQFTKVFPQTAEVKLATLSKPGLVDALAVFLGQKYKGLSKKVADQRRDVLSDLVENIKPQDIILFLVQNIFAETELINDYQKYRQISINNQTISRFTKSYLQIFNKHNLDLQYWFEHHGDLKNAVNIQRMAAFLEYFDDHLDMKNIDSLIPARDQFLRDVDLSEKDLDGDIGHLFGKLYPRFQTLKNDTFFKVLKIFTKLRKLNIEFDKYQKDNAFDKAKRMGVLSGNLNSLFLLMPSGSGKSSTFERLCEIFDIPKYLIIRKHFKDIRIASFVEGESMEDTLAEVVTTYLQETFEGKTPSETEISKKIQEITLKLGKMGLVIYDESQSALESNPEHPSTDGNQRVEKVKRNSGRENTFYSFRVKFGDKEFDATVNSAGMIDIMLAAPENPKVLDVIKLLGDSPYAEKPENIYELTPDQLKSLLEKFGFTDSQLGRIIPLLGQVLTDEKFREILDQTGKWTLLESFYKQLQLQNSGLQIRKLEIIDFFVAKADNWKNAKDKSINLHKFTGYLSIINDYIRDGYIAGKRHCRVDLPSDGIVGKEFLEKLDKIINSTH